MKTCSNVLLGCLLAGAALLAPQTVSACGEGVYNMGQGLRYQGYLAPRPAVVLIYDNRETVPPETKAVYRGLVQAGHRLEVARNPEQVAMALRDHRFDVVIADFERVDAIGRQIAPASGMKILPVVSSRQRGASGLRERFRWFLVEGASLGQHLKLIDQMVKDRV